MEDLVIGYTVVSTLGWLLLWRRSSKWKKAFRNKPVVRMVAAPEPQPEPKVAPIKAPDGDKEKALQLAKRMERVGGRTWEEKMDYMKKKLLRPGHLSVQQAERLIEEAYGILR